MQGPPQPPPYLASQTPDRMSPNEPWVDTLKTVMLVYGVLLVACFVVPWQLSPQVGFAWDVIKSPDATSLEKLVPLLIGGTGLLGVVLALLPLTVSARGVAAAFLGIVPVGLTTFLIGEVDWQAVVGFIGFVTLIAGLLVRSEYYASMVSRVMVTIGVICALVPLLVPVGDAVPLVAMFESVGSAPGKAKIIAVLDIVWLVVTVLALLAWLPAPSSAGAKILAWIFILRPLLEPLSETLIQTPPGDLAGAVKASLFGFALLSIAAMAWTALTGYGVASVAGKSLEPAA